MAIRGSNISTYDVRPSFSICLRSLGTDCSRQLPVLGQLKAPALRLEEPLVLQVSVAVSSSYSGLDSETGQN